MTALALYLLKVILFSGILFLYYHVALRNKVFHQWNRFYLLGAVVLSLIIPVCQITIERYLEAESNSAIQLLQVVQSADGYFEDTTVHGHSGMSASDWLLTVYLAISVILFASLGFSIARIYRIVRTHPVQWIDRIRFLNTEVPGTPFSFLNYIFWNRRINLESETGQQIFEHELVHVQDRHTLDKLFLQVVLACFWCNPFFWLIRNELKLVHEFIADKKAVAQHGTAAFSAMILQAAYPEKFHTITNQFFQTSIKRRLAMLTKIQNPRINYLSRIFALPLLACVIFAFTVRTRVVTPVTHSNKAMTVVIDAGHGMNNGAYTGAQVNGLAEDAIVLALAKKIKEINSDKNLNIVLTRSTSDVVDLHRKVQIAQENNADLFISLHMGAAPPEQVKAASQSNSNKNGFEILVSNKMPPYQQKSEVFASLLGKELSTAYTFNPLLVKNNTGVWVLDKNVCPSIILECGYITDRKDIDYMKQDGNQTIIATRILEAIAQYANNSNSYIPSSEATPFSEPAKGVTISAAASAKPDGEKMAGRKPLGVKESSKDSARPDPLLVVDGKEVGKYSEYKQKMDQDASNISSVNVLKGDMAIKKYGEKGKDGVIEITRKDPGKPLPASTPKDGTSYVTDQAPMVAFTQTDKPASIDKIVWQKYLESHMQTLIEDAARKGTPAGQYTVMLQLLISKEGKVTEVKVVKDPGHDIAPKVAEIVATTSPVWNPATQNGIAVNSYHDQPITFVIADQSVPNKKH